MKANEAAFESSIETWLLDCGGYAKGDPSVFDARRGLDLGTVLGFVQDTQADAWGRLVALHGGDEQVAFGKFADRLAREIEDRGTVDVLRHGVVDHGVTLQLAFFKPAHGLTPELVEQYEANRLTVTRQLSYDPDSTKTLDMCLLVNGIPVATAELKNPLTHQTIEHAIAQYRKDRDPQNTTLGRRAIVHFAVDPEAVAMTTRLDGAQTRFLPFNLGADGGAGNPTNPEGHRTAYLWERVFERDAWMDILARFVHVEMPTSGTTPTRRKAATTIFPRFHQWDAVRSIEADARGRGAGHRYLVQHSAGSGKSNTIAWLAHRLSNLHDEADTKVFDKVIVITDRVVLDRQLQETIYQFEHAHGVVVKIDKDSQQLADALTGEQARIIITTLQKFPFVLDKIGDLAARRYAVIVDEAHSSQTGEAAKDMKAALGQGEAALEAAEEAEFDAEREDDQDLLAKSVRARGPQRNLSFFAFTATPKARTLELFGTRNPETDRFAPFHLYTMRQAIEEGFILDVLANYTTYDTYYRIEKAIVDDPEYPGSKAKASIARWVSLHPHNLAQKAEVIVEHFRTHTAPKIAGRAKAMVVTSSRLHAVRYKQAIDRYITEQGYDEIHALVAFSGTVVDDGLDHTEPQMNGFPESQTAQQFGEGDYQVLVVAEKFQTGYDQPLLHTMFVDKPLQGLYAVQTLSRLNRIHPEKTDTFVLDFRNNIEDIQEAFKPYFDATIAVPTDPNLLYDTHRDLDAFGVLRTEEADEVARLLLSTSGAKEHPRIHALLDLAVDRFVALDEERQGEFRAALQRFINVHAFLAQIVSFADTDLERDYIYGRAVASMLPGSSAGRIDLGSEVELTHLRIEQTFAGRASLDQGEGEVSTIWDGRGPQAEPEPDHLSHIIEIINERFGLRLGPADKLLFDQFEETWASDTDLEAQAQHNDIDNFRLAFDRRFMHTVVTRMDDNEAIFKRILDDDDFRAMLEHYYADKVYRRLRGE
jgi:type I restriction enzyme R subunit